MKAALVFAVGVCGAAGSVAAQDVASLRDPLWAECSVVGVDIRYSGPPSANSGDVWTDAMKSELSNVGLLAEGLEWFESPRIRADIMALVYWDDFESPLVPVVIRMDLLFPVRSAESLWTGLASVAHRDWFAGISRTDFEAEVTHEVSILMVRMLLDYLEANSDTCPDALALIEDRVIDIMTDGRPPRF